MQAFWHIGPRLTEACTIHTKLLEKGTKNFATFWSKSRTKLIPVASSI